MTNPLYIVAGSIAILLIVSACHADALPQGMGLAAKYPGDANIAKDNSVVFAEDFHDSVPAICKRWTSNENPDNKVMTIDRDVPPGSSDKHSLKITATRDQNTGGYLFQNLPQGHDTLFIRFYTKFSKDHGDIHHFVRIRGMIDPRPPYPEGNVSKQRDIRFCGTDIVPRMFSNLANSEKSTPRNAWSLSSYWCEMRSWQGPDGTSFYPDMFHVKNPGPLERDKWACVEVMVKMNSAPDKYDGEQALWIDGKLVQHIATNSIRGRWRRDKYLLDDENGTPFEGMRWRKDMRLKWNRLWLLYHMSDRAFTGTDNYIEKHPDAKFNTKQGSVWFDHLVLAKQYIGPLTPKH